MKQTPEIRGKGCKLCPGSIKVFYGRVGCLTSEEAQSFSLKKNYVNIKRTEINKKKHFAQHKFLKSKELFLSKELRTF